MNNKKNIICVIGTRPEAIKMVPVITTLTASAWANCIVVATAQHRDLLDQILSRFDIKVHYDLNLMKAKQSLNGLLAHMLPSLETIIKKENAFAVLAQGDTASVFGAAMTAFHCQVPFGHIEAGLRTHNLEHPFPEEGYRQMISRITHWHFAPTNKAANALMNEGISEDKIYITGNTGIDTLLQTVAKSHKPQKNNERVILLTAHRRENFGEPLKNIFNAVLKVVESFEDVRIIYPVHPNPNVKTMAHAMLAGHPRIELHEPFGYFDFVAAMQSADLILTDSGGVQEEAPALGKPVLVLRKTTERPEPIEAGVSKLVGTDYEVILQNVKTLLTDETVYRSMSKKCFPYGDGHAAKKIVEVFC